MLARADIAGAVGLIAGTDNDTTNFNARHRTPSEPPTVSPRDRTSRPVQPCSKLRWTRPGADEVARGVRPDQHADVVALHPGDAGAGRPVGGRSHPAAAAQLRCRAPALWKVKLDREQAPAIGGWLAEGRVTLGDLPGAPGSGAATRVVPLLLLRDGEAVLTPGGETLLARDDELLFAGHLEGENSRAPWWSSRPERTCCSISTFHRAGGASCPGRAPRRARLTTAEA